MPRRREPDEEDLMARCPRCQGTGRVYDLAAEEDTDCPVCDGTGRVTRVVYDTYLRP